MRKLMLVLLLFATALAGCGGGGGSSSTSTPTITDEDRRLMHDTVANGTLSEARDLFTRRPELLTAIDSDGEYPIHIAIKYSTLPNEMTALLINLGADPSAKSRWDGYYPIHLAVLYVRVPTVQLLIDKDVDLSVLDEVGETPVYYAVMRSATILDMLLDAGADGTTPNHSGQTPYDLALHTYNGALEVLREHGITE